MYDGMLWLVYSSDYSSFHKNGVEFVSVRVAVYKHMESHGELWSCYVNHTQEPSISLESLPVFESGYVNEDKQFRFLKYQRKRIDSKNYQFWSTMMKWLFKTVILWKFLCDHFQITIWHYIS